jgi:hypothetical protein
MVPPWALPTQSEVEKSPEKGTQTGRGTRPFLVASGL